jgi:GNAT superfamily N-acetyltransferase
MTEPSSTIRAAGPNDSRACYDVFLAAITDLSRRLGTPWDPEPDELWTRVQPMFAMLAEHAVEWWVAEDGGGRLIGYARSLERGDLFELSEFFVTPDSQAAGVGTRLLDRAFPTGRGAVRAIIATTDTRALSRYYRAGTIAQFPIPALAGTPGARSGNGPLDRTIQAVVATPDDLGALRELERSVLGFERGDEFLWLLEQRSGFLYRRGGALVGSAFISPGGGIGPAAAIDPELMPVILDHLERHAAERDIKEVTLDVPGPNVAAMRHLLARGFKMDPFLTVLMASRPFGQFDRFIGFSPPFVL